MRRPPRPLTRPNLPIRQSRPRNLRAVVTPTAGRATIPVATQAAIPAAAQATQAPTSTPVATATVLPTFIPTYAPTTIEAGYPFSDGGNAFTRDLLYDKFTNKQFIAIETRGGDVFYMVIDYDKPLDDKGERYETYFLNLVDNRDLLDIVGENESKEPDIVYVTPEHTAVPTQAPVAEAPQKKNDGGAMLGIVGCWPSRAAARCGISNCAHPRMGNAMSRIMTLTMMTRATKKRKTRTNNDQRGGRLVLPPRSLERRGSPIRKRKRKDTPMLVLAVVLLCAGALAFLLPVLMTDMEITQDAAEYSTLRKRIADANSPMLTPVTDDFVRLNSWQAPMLRRLLQLPLYRSREK